MSTELGDTFHKRCIYLLEQALYLTRGVSVKSSNVHILVES